MEMRRSDENVQFKVALKLILVNNAIKLKC